MTRRWTPAVSLVMPCRNESSAIARTVETLANQDYSGPIELIIVDGQSTDRTLDFVANLKSLSDRFVVRVVRNPDMTAAVGLNLGVAAARGEVIFTLGAHTRYSANYVSGAIAAMLDGDCDAVGSRAITVPGGSSRMARAIALALSCRFGVGDSKMRVGSGGSRRIPADTASCPAYRRHVFEHIGRFNPQLIRNQDIEFNLRLRRAGMKLVLDQGITSAYQARSTLGGLAVNCFSNGYWVIRSLRVCGHAFSARHLVPLLFVMGMIAIMTSVAMLPTSHVARWLIPAAAAVTYAIAGAVSLLATHGPKAIPEALLVFPVMHCSYGLGSLWALLTIWRPVPVRPSVSTSS